MTQTPTITPADIRAGTGTLIFAESERQMIADAIEISDKSAWLMIVGRSLSVNNRSWLRIPDGPGKAIEQAVRYLGSRGLLLHSPDKPNLVRFVEVPE